MRRTSCTSARATRRRRAERRQPYRPESAATTSLPVVHLHLHGLIGRLTAVAGKRDELVDILLAGVSGMPGCLSYVVARDPADADALWITEVWESAAAHAASLMLPSVKDAITRGRPLIARFDQHVTTEPVGGHGLPGR